MQRRGGYIEAMRTRSPLSDWRAQCGLSVAELAGLCNVTEADVLRVEAGEDGLIGEVQDYLTTQGVNVSQMAVGHAEFLVALAEQGVIPEGLGLGLHVEE